MPRTPEDSHTLQKGEDTPLTEELSEAQRVSDCPRPQSHALCTGPLSTHHLVPGDARLLHTTLMPAFPRGGPCPSGPPGPTFSPLHKETEVQTAGKTSEVTQS